MWTTYMPTSVVEGAREERGASGDGFARDCRTARCVKTARRCERSNSREQFSRGSVWLDWKTIQGKVVLKEIFSFGGCLTGRTLSEFLACSQ
jgi:hypothetical protein